MKKILWVSAVLLTAAAIGLAAFLPSLAASKLKNPVLKQIEREAGYPAGMDRLILGWRGGLFAGVEGLRLLESGDAAARTLLSVKRIGLRLPWDFLRKRVFEVSLIDLEGIDARLIREIGGKIRLSGFKAGQRDTAASGVLAGLKALNIKKSRLSFVDLASNPPREMIFEAVRLEIGRTAVPWEWSFEGKATLFDSKQNVALAGRAVLDPQTQIWKIKELDLTAEFESLKNKKVFYALPAMQRELAGWMSGLRDIRIEGRWAGGELKLQKLSARLAQGHLDGSAVVRNVAAPSAATQLRFGAKNLRVEELWSPPDPRQPRLEAKVSADFEGGFEGNDSARIFETLGGNARAELTEPRLMNLNLLRMILEKLKQVPGIPQDAAAYMPPDVQRILAQPVTALAPMGFEVKAGNGGLFFPELKIASPGFEIYASGQMGFRGDVNFRATLVMDARMSAILIQLAPRMQVVADGYGRLALPITITGSVSSLKIVPDMDYILSRAAQVIGQELLTQALKGGV